jgi:UDP-N-acetylmuramoylalanine--D-glutamate ligase
MTVSGNNVKDEIGREPAGSTPHASRLTPHARRALVVGLGLTGLSCVRHLVAQGYEVTGVDTRAAPPKLDDIRREFPRLEIHAGELPASLFADPGVMVVSPGLDLREGPMAQAIARGVRPIGDIELFAQKAAAPVLAITGSNGKSTVTALTGELCRAGGLDARVGGNIGVPALGLLAGAAPDAYVLELSSFQLETTWSLDAHAAVVLNLTADHMDRYADLDSYALAKARIFNGRGVMVLNADDPIVMGMRRAGRRTICFGLGAPRSAEDYGIAGHGHETWLVRGAERLMPASEVPLPGMHNVANVLAAMALAQTLGVTSDACREAVRAFRGLPHRSELVAECEGVKWINDSKGTNVGATIAALNGMPCPVILIAGGDGKGQDFGELREAVTRRARALLLIGRDAPLIERALAGTVPILNVGDLREAVVAARALAHRGDAVLLSPACASFDMFRNYEHRGEVFRATVKEVLG